MKFIVKDMAKLVENKEFYKRTDAEGWIRHIHQWNPDAHLVIEEKLDKLFVVCAAMLMDDGLIVPGVRHFSPEMRIILERIYGENYHLHVKQQGFINQMGEFMSREDAWKLADASGQIRRETGWEEGDKPRLAGVGDDGRLFSENLY